MAPSHVKIESLADFLIALSRRKIRCRVADHGYQLTRLPELTGQPEQAKCSISTSLIDDGLRDGTIEVLGGQIVLTKAGRSQVKRLRHGAMPFHHQHTPIDYKIVDRPSGESRVVSYADDSPLAWLRRRQKRGGKCFIDERQFQAGEQLHADFVASHMAPNVTARWEHATRKAQGRRSGASWNDSLHVSEAVAAARQRVRKALNAVGPELSGVLVDICCLRLPIHEIERGHDLPVRSGKVVLGIALKALARHYNDGRRRGRGPSPWRGEGAVPGLDTWFAGADDHQESHRPD